MKAKKPFNISDYDFSEIHSMQDEMIKKMSLEVSNNKEKVFKERLEQLGIKINFEEEQRKRFKSFFSEYRGDEETIYYNDGSENGLRVITFVRTETPIDYNNNKISVGIDLTYY